MSWGAFAFGLGTLTLLLVSAGALFSALGNRSLPWLAKLPRAAEPLPPVSVVIAARNEEAGIRAGVASVLAQEYAPLEVIAVNDRSTDATGQLLAELASADHRLRVISVDQLPAGWLGKNHALDTGAAAACGELLLFTDADVVLQPSSLARAVGLLQRAELDHLTVVPELDARGWLLDLFVGTFATLFAQFSRPWRAADPEAKEAVGLGAFNLIRADAYREIGGHSRIKLRPDDDMMLGKLVKLGGLSQAVAVGRGMVGVEWYGTLGAAVRGLEKNAFAGFGYSVTKFLAGIVLLLLLNVWPFIAVATTSGATLAVNSVVVVLLAAGYVASTRVSGLNPWYAPAYPLGVLLVTWAMARSVALALSRGGIQWRDTFYPLEELRENRL